MDYKYCYIIDFTAEMICCLELKAAERKPEEFEDDEDLIRYWGFNPNQCYWMFSDKELNINYIVSPLK